MSTQDIKNASETDFMPRTDLALEVFERTYSQNEAPDDDGIEIRTEQHGAIKVTVLEIKNDSGEAKLSKPKGRYVTVETGKIWQYTAEQFENLCDVCARYLSLLISEKGSCLLACLGNRAITADAQGPLSAKSFVVTKHIKDNSPELFSQLALRESSCIVPGVLANTGVEAANIVKGIVERTKPDFIIAVDSLASRSTERLGTTLQMSDAGISPGSGVGNHRMALNRDTLGVPVIAIGVPTVVDAATIGSEILEQYLEKQNGHLSDNVRTEILGEVLKNGSFNFFVTPKNADVLSACAARLIALSVNKALNPDLSYSDMAELCCK